jgi:hypothetical protein
VLLATPGYAQQYSVVGTATSRITYPDAQSNPTASNDSQSFNNTSLPAVLVPTTVSSSVTPVSGASANSTLTGSEGVLHGYATATHPATGDSYYAESVVSVTATDVITLAPMLPAGTPVVANFSLVLNGSATTAACGTACGGTFTADAVGDFSITSTISNGPTLYLHDDPSSTNNLLSGVITGPAGSTLNVSESLTLSAYVNGIQYLGAHPDSATVDYSDTAYFYADALTAGATLVSASGYDYSTPSPVPLPASLPLLLLGVAVVFSVGRRHGGAVLSH